jgi:hypothetical protein
MPEKHSRFVPGGRAVWLTERLWELARRLPMSRVAIAAIPEFDEVRWFDALNRPTCRSVALHARRILHADVTHQVILSADGRLICTHTAWRAPGWPADRTFGQCVSTWIQRQTTLCRIARRSSTPRGIAGATLGDRLP